MVTNWREALASVLQNMLIAARESAWRDEEGRKVFSKRIEFDGQQPVVFRMKRPLKKDEVVFYSAPYRADEQTFSYVFAVSEQYGGLVSMEKLACDGSVVDIQLHGVKVSPVLLARLCELVSTRIEYDDEDGQIVNYDLTSFDGLIEAEAASILLNDNNPTPPRPMA